MARNTCYPLSILSNSFSRSRCVFNDDAFCTTYYFIFCLDFNHANHRKKCRERSELSNDLQIISWLRWQPSNLIKSVIRWTLFPWLPFVIFAVLAYLVFLLRKQKLLGRHSWQRHISGEIRCVCGVDCPSPDTLVGMPTEVSAFLVLFAVGHVLCSDAL